MYCPKILFMRIRVLIFAVCAVALSACETTTPQSVSGNTSASLTEAHCADPMLSKVAAETGMMYPRSVTHCQGFRANYNVESVPGTKVTASFTDKKVVMYLGTVDTSVLGSDGLGLVRPEVLKPLFGHYRGHRKVRSEEYGGWKLTLIKVNSKKGNLKGQAQMVVAVRQQGGEAAKPAFLVFPRNYGINLAAMKRAKRVIDGAQAASPTE